MLGVFRAEEVDEDAQDRAAENERLAVVIFRHTYTGRTNRLMDFALQSHPDLRAARFGATVWQEMVMRFRTFWRTPLAVRSIGVVMANFVDSIGLEQVKV